MAHATAVQAETKTKPFRKFVQKSHENWRLSPYESV